jgi:peptidyl-prolyl cis-trans isomerase D
VSAWAFTARPGETSDLIDGQDAYYVARVDSLSEGGAATLQTERDDIEQELRRQKKLDLLVPRAEKISAAVAKGASLEEAAKAAGLTVQQTPEFARTTSVPGLGQATQAVRAAFGLPKGAVSQPIKSDNGVFVIRVDDRVQADRAAWEKQKEDQRNRVLQGMGQQRVQQFLDSLRESAEIEDHRKEIAQQNRQLAG